jgi:hypothetical protein
MLFAGFLSILMLFLKLTTTGKALIVSMGTITLIIALYALLYIYTDFDIIQCFKESIVNEQKQMSYSGIDSWARYLLISTGNVIAYIGIIGIPALGVVLYGLKTKQYFSKSLSAISIATLISILVFGFSGQFFLEVERIWIFLTPFCLLYAGAVLGNLYDNGHLKPVFSLLLISIGTSFFLRMLLDQCY